MPDSPMNAPFPSTHWSQVVRAADPAEPCARAALDELCSAYWYPLYAFVRRRGFSPDQSAEFVQGTFADLLGRHGLADLSPERGRLRSYLMAACLHHIADRRDHEHAARRGGGQNSVAIDHLGAEGRYAAEVAHELTAERLFERRWATGLLEIAIGRLQAEMVSAGKAELFTQLLPALSGGRGEVSHAAIAAERGMTAGAVKMAASRMRRRYGELLRAEIARTVADPSEVEDEIRALFAALASEPTRIFL